MHMTASKSGSAATLKPNSRPNLRPCVRNLGPVLEGAGSKVIAIMDRAVHIAMVRIVTGGPIPLGSPCRLAERLARAPVVSHERPRGIVGASRGRRAHTRQSKAGDHNDPCGETRDCVHAKTVPEWFPKATEIDSREIETHDWPSPASISRAVIRR